MDIKQIDLNRWHDDATNILAELRRAQDTITETFGYDGFSIVEFAVSASVEGRIVHLRFEGIGDRVLISLVENGTTLDTFFEGIPT